MHAGWLTGHFSCRHARPAERVLWSTTGRPRMEVALADDPNKKMHASAWLTAVIREMPQ